MYTKHANNTNKIIYPDLSYTIVGVAYSTHNDLGRFSREKQYGDELSKKFKEANIPFKRELSVSGTGNIVDFLVDDRIILEIKAKNALTKEDYIQTQRYLQCLDIKLGILINFRSKYLNPVRIVRIDTNNKGKFV